MLLKLAALAASSLMCSGLCAQTVTLTSPGDAQSFNNVAIPLTVSTSGLPAGAKIEYMINGKRLFGELATPYSLTWHAAYLHNGAYRVQAVAHSAEDDSIVASSAINTMNVTAANPTGTLSITTPANLATVSGTITITANGTAPTNAERVLFNYDGLQNSAGVHFLGAGAYSFSETWNTATLGNGLHEIAVGGFMAGASFNAFGFHSIQVNVQNGHLLLGVRANYKTVYLIPGETVTITAKQVFTDNAGDTVIGSGLTFSSSVPGIATVNSSSGLVTGVAKGFTSITVTDGGSGKTATVQVIVIPSHVFPHLAKGKGIQTVYNPLTSLWNRSLYFYGYNAITQASPTGDYAAAGRNAAVSAIEDTAFFNPLNLGSPATFAAWQAQVHPALTNRINIAASNGFAYYAIADDMARQPNLLDNTLNGYGNQSVPDVFTFLKSILVGVTMVDEINLSGPPWGNSPTTGWAGPPAIPTTAFTPTLMGFVNSTPGGRAPITWPTSGGLNVASSTNWTFNPVLSDYGDIYWGYVTDNRFVYPWGPSVQQAQYEQDNKLTSNRIDPAFAFLMGNESITGPGYNKVGNTSSEFAPGTDEIQISGQGPVVVSENLMYAAAIGAAGVRVYGFDDPSKKNQRTTAVKTTNNCLSIPISRSLHSRRRIGAP